MRAGELWFRDVNRNCVVAVKILRGCGAYMFSGALICLMYFYSIVSLGCEKAKAPLIVCAMGVTVYFH